MIQLDEQSHKYYQNGIEIPGVTTILSDVGISDFSMVDDDTLKYAAKRGTAVHKACELFDRDDLGGYSPTIEPYLNSWIDFCRDFSPAFIEIEKLVFCPKYMYAGTLDRVASIGVHEYIVEIKTGQKSRSHQIQMAAYEYAHKKDRRYKMKRLCVYLSKEGYDAEPFEDDDDINVFYAALKTYNFKRNNK